MFAPLLLTVVVTLVQAGGFSSLGTKWTTTGCLLVSQDIEITEVICPKHDVRCLISLPSSRDDITALSGTKIRYECTNIRPWEGSTDTNLTSTCQRDRWLPPISHCDQGITIEKSNANWDSQDIWTSSVFISGCGKSTMKSQHAVPLIWRGNLVKPGEFPWHAGIYENEGEENRKPICGATIIASRYLLSAAHCFADVRNTAKLRDSSDVYIMLGKLQCRNDARENHQQRHEIMYIITHSYRGGGYRYQNDLVIIKTKSEIIFNSNVSPICLINEFFPHIPENADLWVSGWGLFNGSQIQSENLMSTKLPFISYDECSRNPSYEHLSTFLTPEKFCTIGEGGTEKSLDKGDSGGGLVTKGPNNAYYLIGVVSLSLKDSGVVMCTYVPQFHKWIFESTLDIQEKSPRNCKRLRPQNVIIKCIYDDEEINCDDKPVINTEVIPISCLPGYKRRPSTHHRPIHCKTDGYWSAPLMKCIPRTCRKLKPQNVIIKCTYEGKEIDCNEKLFVNTEVIPISCLAGYRRNASTRHRPIHCRLDGYWSAPLMKCIPVCGQPSQTTKIPAIAGTIHPVLPGEFPWHAGVYQKSFNNTLICGATIISSYTLLSAAHCFYDPINDRQRSPVDYEIGVGEITRQTFIAGSETTAFYEVESLIFNNFRGLQSRYQGDIVIIVTKTRISFNFQVSPICMFQDNSFSFSSNELLDVVGWDIGESVLKAVYQPYISADECSRIISPSISEFLSNEKFCTGTNENVNGLGEGYSASGLVYKNSADFAYYLVGIVSFNANAGSSISLNTNVLIYLSWINGELNQIHEAKNEIFSG